MWNFLVANFVLFAATTIATHSAFADEPQPWFEHAGTQENAFGFSSVLVQHELYIFGLNTITVFDFRTDTFKRIEHSIAGYPNDLAVSSDGNIVIGGTRFDREGLSLKDKRQNFIALFDPARGADGTPQTLKKLKDRLSIDVFAREEDISVFSHGDGHLSLSLYSNDLERPLKRIKIDGQAANIAIAEDGHFAITGYSSIDESDKIVPTYWEYTSDLELVEEIALDDSNARSSFGGQYSWLIADNDRVYGLFAWDEYDSNAENISERETDFIKLYVINRTNTSDVKTVDVSPIFEFEPYSNVRSGIRFLISPTGNPLFLYQDVQNFGMFEFDQNSLDVEKSVLSGPAKSQGCFEQGSKFNVIDIIEYGESSFVIFNGGSTHGRGKRCVSIGRLAR